MIQPPQLIVLLHGFFGSPDDWLVVSDLLKAKVASKATETENAVEVVIPDLRATATRPEVQDLESFADWFNRGIRQRKEKIGAEGVYLAGYSMGARLAAQALVSSADSDPSLYSGALLISMHPGIAASDSTQRRDRLKSDLEWSSRLKIDSWSKIWTDWNLQSVLKPGSRWTGPMRSSDADSLAERPLDRSAEASAEAHRHAWSRAMEIWSLANQADLARSLVEWSKLSQHDRSPRLSVMTGNEDSKFTELTTQWVSGQRNIRHRTVLGAGHRVLREAPDDVASEIALLARGGQP